MYIENDRDKILLSVGKAWYRQNPQWRLILKGNLPSKATFGIEVKEYIKALGIGADWMLKALDRENWKQGCTTK